MDRFENELRKQAILNVVMAFLMGFWPFLQVYGSSYFLPFAWTSGTLVAVLGLYLNLPVQDSKESTRNTSENNSSVQPMSTTNAKNPSTLAPRQSTLMLDSFADNAAPFEYALKD
jgi:hypothetical protein